MTRLLTALVCAAMLAGGGSAAAQRVAVQAPEPNPPAFWRSTSEAPSAETRVMAPSPLSEWAYHKTSDGLHPDGNEQLLLWLANRARSNPTQEGIWLAGLCSGGDDLITAACNNPPDWVVNTSVLRSAFATIPAAPPAAFDARLYSAAKSHCDYLVANQTQSHDGQLQRVIDSGFDWFLWAGIVFSYSENTIYGHAGFNIDWGPGPNGMQDPPGHRKAIMSVIDPPYSSYFYSNVGYAIVNSNTNVGPQVITGNYAYADSGSPNRFIVGTVWEDTNGNRQYDPGEGLNGVMVMPDNGTYYAITGVAGGYAIPIFNAGAYTLTFSGGELNGNTYTRTVTVGSVSALQDLEYYSAGDSSTNPGTWYGSSGGGGSGGSSNSGGGGGGGGGCFIVAVAGVDAAGHAVPPLAAMVAALAVWRSAYARRNGTAG